MKWYPGDIKKKTQIAKQYILDYMIYEKQIKPIFE